MIGTIQNYILEYYLFINSLNFGVYFIATIASIIYLIIFICTKNEPKSKLKKIIFVPALLVSLTFILGMIIAGDIRSEFSAEKTARIFLGELCNDGIENIIENKNKVFTPNYCEQFVDYWKHDFKKIRNICCDAFGEDFFLVEKHYELLNIGIPQQCMVVLEITHFLNLPDIKKDADIVQCDYYFRIDLKKLAVKSRFLGNYLIWKIDSLSYDKSEPYSMKEWLDQLKNNDMPIKTPQVLKKLKK